MRQDTKSGRGDGGDGGDAPAREADAVDLAAVFAALPGVDLVLAPDAPRYTMLAATAGRLAATMTTRASTLGRPLFEVFPDANPANDAPSGVGNLRASLDTVLRTRAPHRMAVQRYDLQRPDGMWEARYWAPLNVPVLGPDGAVRYLVHRVEDVTDAVRLAAEGDRLRGAAAGSERARARAEAARDASATANALLEGQALALALANRQLQAQAAELEAQAAALAERTAAAERALDALAESEARFRAVQDASPDGSVLMRPVAGSAVSGNALSGHAVSEGGKRDAAGGPADGGHAGAATGGAITDFTFVYANAATARLLGPAAEGLVGRSLCAVYPHSPTNGYLAGYVRAFENGVPFVIEEDYTRFGKPVHLTMTAMRAGDLVHARFADVSAAVEARAERERLLAGERAARLEAEEARGAAEAASRAKGEFLAVMSHELRTPLNAIGGYTELIEMGLHGPVTAEQHTALDRIQRSQRALLSVINEVLNYARLETGAVTYALADVPVAEAVAEAETLVAPQLRAKGLACSWAECDLGLVVRADRDKLQQVLRNLLSNAIKFTNARPGLPGRIDVSCARHPAVADPAAAGQVTIRVHDTGVGIAADKLEAVFEPFVQVDTALTRTQQGTGLGLAISRDLARGMGGDLTAESTPGVGSTFTLTLPAAP